MDIIALTTDFGIDDPYVAAMKGVILSINPRVTIVDICHTIEPQNIAQAAFVLSTIYHYFPEGTIHIVVVDPGVGTERRAVLLITPLAFFLAPDNGVLSYVIEETPPEDLQAITLSNPHFWLFPVSATFHGRDIFAPVAAHLSLGTSPQDFGDQIDTLFTLPMPRPKIGEDGVLSGHILHIDRFGNLITDIRMEDLPKGNLFIDVGGHFIESLSPSYAEGEELLAIIGSSGRLEISLKNGNAAALLRAKVGSPVRISSLGK